MISWSVESRMRGNTHVRFGGAGRGNGPRAIRHRASARPYAEAFFATLETELIDRSAFRNRTDARVAVFDYIENFYNKIRRHSAIGQLSPVEFERRWLENNAVV